VLRVRCLSSPDFITQCTNSTAAVFSSNNKNKCADSLIQLISRFCTNIERDSAFMLAVRCGTLSCVRFS